MNAEEQEFKEVFAGGLPPHWVKQLRRLWQESSCDDGQDASAEDVFDRLEKKYQPLLEVIEDEQGTMAADCIRARLKQMNSFQVALKR